MKNRKEKALDYYNQEAKVYEDFYRPGYKGYPFQRIRQNFVLELLKNHGVKTVLDAGCGTAVPITEMLDAGMDASGFDFSLDMVLEGKKILENAGHNPDRIFKADLEDESSLPKKKFDAIIALGVFPHILLENIALDNIKSMLNPGGIALIEFRNDLFAAYTMNKYSVDFYLNRLIPSSDLPLNIFNDVADFYVSTLNVEKPQMSDGKIHYSSISAKFHNPLSVGKDLFEPNGFRVINNHFYHYHALPPIFEKKYPKVFRELSLEMEKTDDVRGYFMASAFVVEARKND